VVAQAALIRDQGGEAQVFALEDRHSAEDRARFGGSTVHFARVAGPGQIGFAPALARTLVNARLDCLHLHGIWMYPSRAGYLWAKRTGGPFFISPHGMLDPWITARGVWKKALARIGYERAAWASAKRLHALTAREAEDIARETGRQDSVVIPNSCPIARPDRQGNRAPDALYIGRVHTKKNLVALVQGWMQARKPEGARLRIAGWGAAVDVADLRAAIGSADGSVEFLGPVYGEAKAALIGEARFMVLPSHSEGLPMAVLEAWALATPVIMTAECNLPEGFAAGAARECGYDPADIASALESALAISESEWRTMAAAAHALAVGQFSSAAVAARWSAAYVAAMEGTTAQ
ncbi:MAG: glycosyltransferase, partial [Novosphingobium sp.]